MALFKNHVGLHISQTSLKFVEVCNRNNSFTVENVDEEYFSELLNFSEKETKIITILQSAFNELLFRNRFISSTISISLPSNLFRFFDLPYDDALTKKDLEEQINWEISILQPNLDIEELSIQKIDLKGSKLRYGNNIILITIVKNFIKILNKFCQRNNLKLRYIDNEHFTAINVLNLFGHIEPAKIYFTIFVHEKYSTLVLLEGITPVYIRYIEYTDLFTLAGNISSELEKISLIVPESLDIEKTFIFGENYSESFTENLKESTGLAAVSIDPFEKIGVHEKYSISENKIKLNPRFCSAAGMSYRLF